MASNNKICINNENNHMNKFIQKLTIQNFKSIKELKDFELRNINILIGINGAGKSNFLSFFSFLRSIIDVQLNNYVQRNGGADSLLTFGKKRSDYLLFSLDFGSSDVFKSTLAFNLTYSNNDNLYIADAKIYENEIEVLKTFSPFSELNLKEIEIPDYDNGALKLIKDTAKWVSKVTQYHFDDVSDTSPIKSQCALSNDARLLANGKNIAPFLYRLKQGYKSNYDMLIKTIRAVIPDFYDFYFADELAQSDSIYLRWINKNDINSVSHASKLSDGSLRFICLATVLLQPLELMPEIVIIDEPELGLHPQALALVASLVQRLSMQRQFIIATQSSSFIDMFAAHDIVVVDKEKDGTSKFTRLDEDKLAHWLDDEYSITDLWDMNIIGGRP